MRCPICLCGWKSGYEEGKKTGALCGDRSQGQQSDCVGRLMPEADFERAEWRTPFENEDGTPVRQSGGGKTEGVSIVRWVA